MVLSSLDGARYGITQQAIVDMIGTGRICILDVDVQACPHLQPATSKPGTFCLCPQCMLTDCMLAAGSVVNCCGAWLLWGMLAIWAGRQNDRKGRGWLPKSVCGPASTQRPRDKVGRSKAFHLVQNSAASAGLWPLILPRYAPGYRLACTWQRLHMLTGCGHEAARRRRRCASS